ncbi:hypothetical protein H6F43_03850 [Leptolyngbya sp. FACHB-36]|uniref:hypothetical protein n=1 Tax=Leptolyngbya sp. FACHB-36 TaxID=2692808 RepID=UPI0016817204|nr:hypothetical protein [Leptolyngbya sp. FACHB-36]MBD2019316.1 hypothetical protein [Leptolyngbya sp. FACHB-36]
MLYDADELEQRAAEALKGRTPEEFLTLGTERLTNWLRRNPRSWMAFGPYWAVMQSLLQTYQPDYVPAATWNDGNPAPDFLSRYNYNNDLLNWVAGMSYLNREGDVFSDPEQPHSIQLPDDSQALYIPTIGLIES